MNLPRAIRTCRLARGLTQQQLARSAAISTSYLSLLESGKKEPSLQLLGRLADALELSIDLLMMSAIDDFRLRETSDDVARLFGQMLRLLGGEEPSEGLA